VKLAWMRFFPADWLADVALNSCSLAARGAWIGMLCLCAQAPRTGFLQLPNGAEISPETLAKLLGIAPREARSALIELEQAGVFSRDETGAIYSRRMVKDAAFREKQARNGRKGGNPKLTGWDKPKDKAGDNGHLKLNRLESTYAGAAAVNPPAASPLAEGWSDGRP
jgi:hypothetical protein